VADLAGGARSSPFTAHDILIELLDDLRLTGFPILAEDLFWVTPEIALSIIGNTPRWPLHHRFSGTAGRSRTGAGKCYGTDKGRSVAASCFAEAKARPPSECGEHADHAQNDEASE